MWMHVYQKLLQAPGICSSTPFSRRRGTDLTGHAAPRQQDQGWVWVIHKTESSQTDNTAPSYVQCKCFYVNAITQVLMTLNISLSPTFAITIDHILWPIRDDLS